MKKKSNLIIFSACLSLGIIASQVNAEFLLIEDFDDLNVVAEDWGNAIAGGTDPFTSPGLGLAIRTREVFPIGFADLEAAVVTNSGSGVFQVGEDGAQDGDQPFSQVAPSDRTTSAPLNNYQFAGYQLVRTGLTFDSTPYKYFRFSAWLDDPAASYENIVDAGVVLNFSDDVTNTSTGPFDLAGSDIEAIQITNQPNSYIVEINNGTTFKVDPVFNSLFGTQNVDETAIRSLQLGFRRANETSGQTNNLGTRWFIDDLAFYVSEPDILTTGPVLSTLNENPADSTTFDIVLNAEPFDGVTVNFAASDGSAFNFTPASFTFLPDGVTPGANEAAWDQVQTITVTTVDNSVMNSSASYDVEFTQTTTDLFYDELPVAPLTISVNDDESTATVNDWRILNN